MTKLNCWEFMKCGREIGGKNAAQLGVCIVAREKHANGIHGGVNAGRCCWTVAGTFCNEKIQGTFVEKFKDCAECPFYKLVGAEESNYLTASEIKKKMDSKAKQ